MARHRTEPMPEYLTRQQVAAICAVSPKTVGNWEKKGRIPPAIRISTRTYRYPRQAVLDCLRELEVAAPKVG